MCVRVGDKRERNLLPTAKAVAASCVCVSVNLCVCVCVCVWEGESEEGSERAYVLRDLLLQNGGSEPLCVFIYMCVCVCVCAWQRSVLWYYPWTGKKNKKKRQYRRGKKETTFSMIGVKESRSSCADGRAAASVATHCTVSCVWMPRTQWISRTQLDTRAAASLLTLCTVLLTSCAVLWVCKFHELNEYQGVNENRVQLHLYSHVTLVCCSFTHTLHTFVCA